MPGRDNFRPVAEELHDTVFGPRTDLHTLFAVDDVDAALRFAEDGAFGQKRCEVLHNYGVKPRGIPEMVGQLAAFDEYAQLNACGDDERALAAGDLHKRVAGFLKTMLERYPELCPPEYLASHRTGLCAVALLMEGNGRGSPVYRSLRVESDMPDPLGGRPVRTSHLAGSNPPWSISMIVSRGMSFTQAREFEAQYGQAATNGDPAALEQLRSARDAVSLERESSDPTREPS